MKRDSRGRFVKGKASRSSSTTKAMVASGRAVPARITSTRAVIVPRRSPRRSGGGGGGGGGIRYLGGVRRDDLMASVAIGAATRSVAAKGYVRKVVDMSGPLARLGAFGVLAVGAGVLAHQGFGRQVLMPIARSASVIAAFKLTANGGLYDGADAAMSSMSGDDDDGDVGEDDMDVGAYARDVDGDPESAGDDDDESAGDDDDDE